MEFIISAANLHAYNYGLRGETDPNLFRKVAESVIVPEFTPKSGVKVQVSENEPPPQAEGGAADRKLYLSDVVTLTQCHYSRLALRAYPAVTVALIARRLPPVARRVREG